MKHRISSIAVSVAVIAIPGAAFAQFSIPSILGGSSKSNGSSAQPDLSGQQTTLVKNYVAADTEVLTANSKMAEALGLKDKAADASAVAQQLSTGSTADKSSAETSDKAIADTGGAISQKLAEKPALDAQAKEKFAEGIGHLAKGVIKFSNMHNDVTSMGTNLKSASPMQMLSLGGATYVVSHFPTSAMNVGKALKNSIDFAKSNNIPVPADATQALSAL